MDRWRGCRPSSCTSSNRRRNGNAGNYAAPRAQIGDARRGRRAPGCRSDRFKDFDGSALAGWTPRRQAPALAPPLARPRCAKNVRSPSRASRRWSPGWCLYGQIYEKNGWHVDPTFVRYAPKHWLRAGERWENASRRLPESQPPNNLRPVVRNWVRAITKGFTGRGEASPRHSPDLDGVLMPWSNESTRWPMRCLLPLIVAPGKQPRSESTGGHKVRPQTCTDAWKAWSRHSDRQ